MPSVGPLEMLIVGVVAILVLGPRRLPEFGRSLGNGMREFTSALSLDEAAESEKVEQPASRPRDLSAPDGRRSCLRR